METIFNQVIIPMPVEIGSYSAEGDSFLISGYILLNIIFILSFIYRFFKFKKLRKKDKSIWTNNIWNYIFKDSLTFNIFKDDDRYPGKEQKYVDLTKDQLPTAESLKMTIERVMPYWKNEIAPKIKEGKKIIISAHGNSLRALVKHLDGISDDDISSLNIPTGRPLVYEFDQEMNVKGKYYLGDQEEINKEINKVKNQAEK